MSMTNLNQFEDQPLGRLLGGVKPDVFYQKPATIGLRDLQRDMSSVLHSLRENDEYRVITSRGAPAFLLIPLDPSAWASLLAVAPPEMEAERNNAHRRESAGGTLPTTEDILKELPS